MLCSFTLFPIAYSGINFFHRKFAKSSATKAQKEADKKQEALEKEAGRSVNISAVHAALRRLEKKGFVRSDWSEATKERGGRRKRLFSITQEGETALVEIRSIRDRLWGRLPDLGTNLGFA